MPLAGTSPGPDEEELREWERRYLWGLVRGDDAGELAKFNGGVAIRNTFDGSPVATFKTVSGSSHFGRLAFLPDGERLAIGQFAGRALNARARSGEVLRDLAAQTLAGTNHFMTIQGTIQAARIKVWSQTDRKLLHQFQSKPGGPPQTSAAFASTGAIATGHGDGSVSLWETKTGVPVTNFPAHRRIVVGLAFSRDATLLATGGEEGLAKILDLVTFREIAALKGHLRSIHSLESSASGQRLATGGSGAESVKIWDLRTHQELMTLGGSSSLLRDLSFSPDGNVLAGRTDSGRLHLWRAPSWKEIERRNRGRGRFGCGFAALRSLR